MVKTKIKNKNKSCFKILDESESGLIETACLYIPKEIFWGCPSYSTLPYILIPHLHLFFPQKTHLMELVEKEGKRKTHCKCQTPSAKRTRKWVSQAMARWSTFSWEQKMNNQIASASAKSIQLCLMGQEGDKCLACPHQQTGAPDLVRVQRKAAFQLRTSFSR